MMRPAALAAALLAAAVVASALWAAYMGSRDSPLAPAPAAETVRLALSRGPHTALLHIAAARGYLGDEGIEATIVPATHGKAALELLVDGKADAAAAADAPFLIAAMRGADIRVAAALSSALNESAIVARRDRGIEAPAQIAGKRVGVTFGTSAEYFLRAFLIRSRVPTDSVALVDVAPNAIERELAAGTVDAVATWHPIVAAAQAALGARAIAFSAPDISTTTFLLVVRRELAERRPKAIEGMVRALVRAEAFARERPEEAFAVLAARLGTDPALLRPALRNFVFKVELPQSQLVTLEAQARWAMSRGYVAQGPVPNFLPYLHLDAVLAVDPARVTVLR